MISRARALSFAPQGVRMDRQLAALVAVVLAPGACFLACVSKGRFDAAVDDARTAHTELASALDRAKADEARIATLKDSLDGVQAQMQARDQKLGELSTVDHKLQAQLDDGTAINAKLRGELERLGQNVDQLLNEKGTLASALDDARSRLGELRKAEAAAEARAQLFQHFVQKFKSMTDAGQLKITTRNGRLVLQLPNDVLFDTGQTALKPAGKDALLQVARVLATIPGRAFQVAGHTDNVPIDSARFPSNWELSTARAVEVVKLLVSQGIGPKTLSAAGYGEFDPVASNDAPDGRAKNRRIEITLQPNLDELAAAPQVE
jgi:chemotaxis protein MotB